jgi:hypothetical protein
MNVKISNPSTPDNERERSAHLVVLIHGIRDFGEWQDLVRTHLQRIEGIVVESLGYDYYGPLRFLIPAFFQRRSQAIIADSIRMKKNLLERTFDEVRISVIAHSFGTHVIIAILENNADIHVENLILCGSVLPRLYDFKNVSGRVSGRIINEVGCRDIWPVMAKIATFGYGTAGTFGFQRSGPENRYYDFRHGDYFSASFIERNWVTLFQTSNEEHGTKGLQFQRRHPPYIRWLGKLSSGLIPMILVIALFTISPLAAASAGIAGQLLDSAREVIYGPRLDNQEFESKLKRESAQVTDPLASYVISVLSASYKKIREAEAYQGELGNVNDWQPFIDYFLAMTVAGADRIGGDFASVLLSWEQTRVDLAEVYLPRDFKADFIVYSYQRICEFADKDRRLPQDVMKAFNHALNELEDRRLVSLSYQCRRFVL